MSKKVKRGDILQENSDWVNPRKCIFIRREGDEYAVVWLDETGYPESIGRVQASEVVPVNETSSIDITL